MDKKSERVITLYQMASEGAVLKKAELAAHFDVNERTIQRDIDDVRAYLANNRDQGRDLVYDRAQKGFVLVESHPDELSNSEILCVVKILLESRSMVKEEMYPIIDKLIRRCVPHENYQKVDALIRNEKYHYLEPHHGRKFIGDMWQIGSAVYEHRLMRIRYRKLKGAEEVTRLIQPVGIMFSEYYFYLCAYIAAGEEERDKAKHPFPTIYRIDRIDAYEILDEHFHIPYADRFEEGEFRKRIQFMFGGELRTVTFRYSGLSIEAILDRLPTAEVLSHDETGYTIRAEVYGDGIDMWFRSQGDMITLLE